MIKRLLVVRNIKISLDASKSTAEHDFRAVEKARKMYMSGAYKRLGKADFFVYKKSVDARKKDAICFIYSIAALPEKENFSGFGDFECIESKMPEFDILGETFPKKQHRPVVVGFGPCGMFCAYALAKAGLMPLVIERGSDIDKRSEKVKKYWETSVLDTETNVQFGEGGAGTFSDGKLLTRISDPLVSFVLDTFVSFGAPEEIMYLAKPHIGTDLLKSIVKNMRKEIERLGGKIVFDTKLTGINLSASGYVSSVTVNECEQIPATAMFLCIGHSARDTFSMLKKTGITLSAKPFSVGFRIEHLQEDIDKALYGSNAGCEALEKGQYTLSAKKDGRAVYSFCMCPGGQVVASASEEKSIVTNGMSNFARDGVNANSAIAVSVDTADYGNTVEGAVNFQKQIEKAAFLAAGGKGAAPVQLLSDYLNGTGAKHEPKRIMPSYTGKTELCDISKLFPEYINSMLRYGFSCFEKNISGFSVPDAVITAPETRTSSPVRIDRTSDYVSVSSGSIYPCGEGAGYAGGITSAAVDGLKSALRYITRIKNDE